MRERGAFERVFDAASVVGFVLAWVALCARYAGAASGPEIASAVLLLALPALVGADLGAGLLHWFADTFFERTTPLLGPTLIHAFRDHHRDPRAIARRGVVEVSGQNCFACILLLAPVLALDLARASHRSALAFALLFTLAIALTNLFHRWAHAERVSPPVAALQRSGWILSPERHALHHSGAHRSAYCVTTGWLNAPLDRARFFARVESRVRQIQRALSRLRRPRRRSRKSAPMA